MNNFKTKRTASDDQSSSETMNGESAVTTNWLAVAMVDTTKFSGLWRLCYLLWFRRLDSGDSYGRHTDADTPCAVGASVIWTGDARQQSWAAHRSGRRWHRCRCHGLERSRRLYCMWWSSSGADSRCSAPIISARKDCFSNALVP